MNNSTIFCIIAIAMMAVLVFASAIIERKREANGEDTSDIEAAQEIALSVLSRVGLKLFTDAEIHYGGGTGQLKMSSVVANLLPLLPEWVRSRINTVWLSEQLEKYLELAKEKWLANPALVREPKK